MPAIAATGATSVPLSKGRHPVFALLNKLFVMHMQAQLNLGLVVCVTRL